MIKNPPRPMKKGETEYRDEYVRYRREMTVCYDLVSIARHILRNPALRLKTGTARDGIERAATDGTTIFLPSGHPQLRLVTKHELSHLYFKSDIPLRLEFVKNIVSELEHSSGKQFAQIIKEKLITDLCFVINILDDLRVNSLWGLIYPGDGDEMQEWYQKVVGPDLLKRAEAAFPNGDIEHLFTYMILLCLYQEPKSTKWERFRGQIEEAREKVVFKTFKACLIITKELVLSIAKEIAEKEEPKPPEAQPQPDQGDFSDDPDIDQALRGQEEEPQEPKQDLVQALSQVEMSQAPKDLDEPAAGFDHKTQPKGPPDFKDLQELSEVKDVEEFLQKEEEKAFEEAQKIQTAMQDQEPSAAFESEHDYISKGAKAQLVITRVPRNQVVPYIRTMEDESIIRRWRGLFYRILSAQENRAEPVGYELIPELYIHQKLSKEPLRCFRHDTTGRGFKAKLLIDMSGSMTYTFQEVERLAFVLQAATDFPFVDIELWGFNSLKAGQVSLYRYPKGIQGLRSPRSRVEGTTPLPNAIQTVGRSLHSKADDNYLFILTDGFPVYQLEGRKYQVSPKLLMSWTADAVRNLKTRKVKTYCFMIDGGFVPETPDMNRMFGEKNWKRIQPSRIYEDSLEFITKRFMAYLRAR